MRRVVGRDEGHRFDGAGGGARSAARAGRAVDGRQEVGRVDRVEEAEAALGDHGLAATAAAVADEADPVPDVLAELDEVAGPGLVEQGQPFGGIDGPGVAVADEGRGGVVEGHADVEGRVAGAAGVLHLVPAVAEPDPPMGGVRTTRWPLVVEEWGRSRSSGPLVDKDPAELGLPRVKSA